MRDNLLSTEKQGSKLVLLAGLFWGTSGTVQAFAPSQASPFTIGAIRITFGGIFLLLYILATRGFQGFRGEWPLRNLFYAALGMAGFQAFFFAAIRITGVAVGTMVAVGSSPAFAGLLGMFFFKERPSPYWYLSTFLAIMGCILLSWKSGGLKANSFGVLLALVASFAFALCGIGIKEIQRYHGAMETVAMTLCCGALILSPILIFHDISWLMEIQGLLVAIHLGSIATALPYILFALGLTLVPVAKVYTLSLSEPLTACLLGILLLGERLSLYSGFGIFLILLGLLLLSREQK